MRHLPGEQGCDVLLRGPSSDLQEVSHHKSLNLEAHERNVCYNTQAGTHTPENNEMQGKGMWATGRDLDMSAHHKNKKRRCSQPARAFILGRAMVAGNVRNIILLSVIWSSGPIGEPANPDPGRAVHAEQLTL